ncbi:MAG: Gfo/Idh/MocA family oxidoreductase, partial [Acutalibacter sp.]|nr:Gfo/Idh/MocA family oxidoreductase [Acutalibacter sp.]
MRCAIVGCGGIAQVHAGVLFRLESAELAAFADIRPERAQALACLLYTSPRPRDIS